ncbi:MAG: TetR/AcrR family transcriptional regulator [Candidatus Firestonebacteria bacterium]|nr:TetR/AcrR family transcriptional regulator [Candidatus Firestonebacteria bacterium]
MRISKENKEKTRKNIFNTAKKLFIQKGYENTTTRDIAYSAGIASGTLFNYFSNKEELAMAMIQEAISDGRKDYLAHRSEKQDFAEELFLLISSELRKLRTYRKFIGPVFESAMSLFSKQENNHTGKKIREEHLKIVQEIINKHKYKHNNIPEFIISNLYLSLYLSILAFWSKDNSYNQEETLALLDYSVNILVQTIKGTGGQS